MSGTLAHAVCTPRHNFDFTTPQDNEISAAQRVLKATSIALSQSMEVVSMLPLMSSRMLGLASASLALGFALTGCPSPADESAMRGVDALERCDVRGARDAFTQAREAGSTRADVALGAALTDLATLPEDPAFTSLAPRLGFDRPIDMAIFWGTDGLLDRLARMQTCEQVNAGFLDRFPHPSIRRATSPAVAPNILDTIDPTLTIGDLRTALRGLSPRLQRDAEALEFAALNLEEGGVSFEAACGVTTSPTRVQAPELFLLAASLEAVRAATQALEAYDGAIPFVQFLRGSGSDLPTVTAWVNMMNGHFMHLEDPAPLAATRPILVRVTDLGLAGIAAARTVSSPPDAIFNWSQLPAEVLSDSEAFATAARTGMTTEGPVAIPGLTPTLSIDLGSFLDTPFDMGSHAPSWMVEPGDGYPYASFDSSGIEADLGGRFMPNPWRSGAPSYSWNVDWSDISGAQWEAFIDPADRWSTAYSCTSGR